MNGIKLSEMSYRYFEIHDAWKVIIDSYQEEELRMEPAFKNQFNQVQCENGEVWCLCQAIFNDGSIHKASAMCRADSNEGPLLLSFWNDSEDVTLILPPAPDFVLDTEGPIPFAQKFSKNFEEVFPIKFFIIPLFEFPPTQRQVELNGKSS